MMSTPGEHPTRGLRAHQQGHLRMSSHLQCRTTGYLLYLCKSTDRGQSGYVVQRCLTRKGCRNSAGRKAVSSIHVPANAWISTRKKFRVRESMSHVRISTRAGSTELHICGSAGGRTSVGERVRVSYASIRCGSVNRRLG